MHSGLCQQPRNFSKYPVEKEDTRDMFNAKVVIAGSEYLTHRGRGNLETVF